MKEILGWKDRDKPLRRRFKHGAPCHQTPFPILGLDSCPDGTLHSLAISSFTRARLSWQRWPQLGGHGEFLAWRCFKAEVPNLFVASGTGFVAEGRFCGPGSWGMVSGWFKRKTLVPCTVFPLLGRQLRASGIGSRRLGTPGVPASLGSELVFEAWRKTHSHPHLVPGVYNQPGRGMPSPTRAGWHTTAPSLCARRSVPCGAASLTELASSQRRSFTT